jgi:hypothetical protein
MKKKLMTVLLALSLAVAPCAYAGSENSREDEVSHYAAGGVIGGLVAYYLPEHIPFPMRVILGTAAGMLGGTLKEGLYDDHFDNTDLMQWGMGAAVSSAVISIPFSL